MWPSACHSHITRPVLTSTSWTTESVTTACTGPPTSVRFSSTGANPLPERLARVAHVREVQLHGVECVDPRGSLCAQQELVQVRVVAVAGEHVGDRLIGGVVDLVLALAEAESQDATLPPR